MLRWAFFFLIIALVAGLLGFTNISATASEIARILFYIFLFFFILAILLAFFFTRLF